MLEDAFEKASEVNVWKLRKEPAATRLEEETVVKRF
jgi:hypothetical protein